MGNVIMSELIKVIKISLFLGLESAICHGLGHPRLKNIPVWETGFEDIFQRSSALLYTRVAFGLVPREPSVWFKPLITVNDS